MCLLVCANLFIASPGRAGTLNVMNIVQLSWFDRFCRSDLAGNHLRVGKKVQPEVGEGLCRFVEGGGAAGAVYLLGIMVQCSLEVHKDLCLLRLLRGGIWLS